MDRTFVIAAAAAFIALFIIAGFDSISRNKSEERRYVVCIEAGKAWNDGNCK